MKMLWKNHHQNILISPQLCVLAIEYQTNHSCDGFNSIHLLKFTYNIICKINV